jgi:hypothetical protein
VTHIRISSLVRMSEKLAARKPLEETGGSTALASLMVSSVLFRSSPAVRPSQAMPWVSPSVLGLCVDDSPSTVSIGMALWMSESGWQCKRETRMIII